jgi:site-specific DNA-methyltransferase (adenine-specific)
MRKEQFGSVTIYQGDCMEYMAGLKDKEFDLAIVDPPYGLGDKKLTQGGTWASKYKKGDCAWDVAPSSDYFLELQRATKNWIVWGGNYFSHELPAARCFIVWRKLQMLGMHTMADCELALTSFDKNAKIWDGNNAPDRIHPTQKPKELYEWLLHNYAKPEQRILDTHLGSGSSAIAAYYFGCEFVGVELDPDYFEAACKRLDLAARQAAMF